MGGKLEKAGMERAAQKQYNNPHAQMHVAQGLDALNVNI